MPELEVPGATLHYIVSGQGPLLLAIPFALGHLEIYYPITPYLASQFTVVAYDRRGFSRSILNGAQDYEHRLERDADDAAALIKHLSPNEPATVLGSSSGGIVALELLARHPDLVKTLIAHEPPAIRLNPDFEEAAQTMLHFYDVYRHEGVDPAIDFFIEMTKTHPAEASALKGAFDPRAGPYIAQNTLYWFEREVRPYPLANFTPERFEPHKNKLILANSEITPKEAFHWRANQNLAKALGVELKILPAGHVGYASHPEEWANGFLAALQEKREY